MPNNKLSIHETFGSHENKEKTTEFEPRGPEEDNVQRAELAQV